MLARASRHLKSSLDLFDNYACLIKIEQNNSMILLQYCLKFIATEEWKGTELCNSYLHTRSDKDLERWSCLLT